MSSTALQQVFALARARGVTPCLAAMSQRCFFSQAAGKKAAPQSSANEEATKEPEKAEGDKPAAEPTATDATKTEQAPEAAQKDTKATKKEPEVVSAEDAEKIMLIQQKIAVIDEKTGDIKEKIQSCKQDAAQATKRYHQNMENASKYAITKIAKDMLDVADNIDRAKASITEEDRAQCKDLAAIYDKVNEADTLLQKVFADNGIKKEDPMGQNFDPNKHEALFEFPVADKNTGEVAHVIQPGYKIYDRVRPWETASDIIDVIRFCERPRSESSVTPNSVARLPVAVGLMSSYAPSLLVRGVKKPGGRKKRGADGDDKNLGRLSGVAIAGRPAPTTAIRTVPRYERRTSIGVKGTRPTVKEARVPTAVQRGSRSRKAVPERLLPAEISTDSDSSEDEFYKRYMKRRRPPAVFEKPKAPPKEQQPIVITIKPWDRPTPVVSIYDLLPPKAKQESAGKRFNVKRPAVVVVAAPVVEE
ncbi:Mitochondrial matrix cochaperone [Perkinsus chesapeaki]|uniref:Mitochondrial matrix cochaperone n=1 Tax=Perkinsus chesapeaki TaxID=330153 RepID=A0A7J6LRV7_PERCH|nr:Mitochondrial matrix cochaperone [Perkinsus chesapeaki]